MNNGVTVKIDCYDFYQKAYQLKPLSTTFPSIRYLANYILHLTMFTSEYAHNTHQYSDKI